MYDLHEDKEGMLQEYPFEPIDSFITSGDSIFDTDKIEERKNQVIQIPVIYGMFRPRAIYSTDGLQIKLENVDFNIESGGDWKIFKKPEDNKQYICICDPTGKVNRADYSCIQVLDGITAEQVAVFHSNELDHDALGMQLVCVGMYYNNALISSENNIATEVLNTCVKCGYPNIYFEQAMLFENSQRVVKSQMGHTTTSKNRDEMIQQFRIAFNRNPEIINDYETLNEMGTFQRVAYSTITKKSRIEASVGNHDDLVMAYVPFWRLQNQLTITEHNFDYNSSIVDSFTTSHANDYMDENDYNNNLIDTYGIDW